MNYLGPGKEAIRGKCLEQALNINSMNDDRIDTNYRCACTWKKEMHVERIMHSLQKVAYCCFS